MEAISKLPRKYIIYGDEDQNNVIALFDIVREVMAERDHISPNFIAASQTARILHES